MMNCGTIETKQLRKGIEDQVGRLLTQLQDLEVARDDLSEEEYLETKNITLDQLAEFESSLARLNEGDIQLTNGLKELQGRVRSAIGGTIKPSETIKIIEQKEITAQRSKLDDLKSEYKLGKLTEEIYHKKCIEILESLKKMGENLAANELTFLEKVS